MSPSLFNWYAIYTKSKSEFAVEEYLKRKELIVYLPTTKRLRHWNDRKKWINFPLFPGYMFVYVQPQFHMLVKVLSTKGVVTILGPEAKQPTPIPDKEIDGLRRIVASQRELFIFPFLKIGKRVKVKNGPLKGIEGVVDDVGPGDKCRFLISIGPVGRTVGVNISAADLESA